MLRVFLESSGKVSSTILGSAEMLNLNTKDDAVYVDLSEDQRVQTSDYWDEKDKKIVSIGNAPSTYQTFNYVNKQWEDNRDLKALQEIFLTKLKVEYQNKELGGFEFMGKVIQSNLISQQRIQSIIVEESIDWITADNSTLTLTSDQFGQMKISLSIHLQKVRADYNKAKENVLNMTLEQLKEIENV